MTGGGGALFLDGGRRSSFWGLATSIGGRSTVTGGVGSEIPGSGVCVFPINVLKNLEKMENILFNGLKKFIL